MGLFQRRNAAVESNGHGAEPPTPAVDTPAEISAATAAVPPVPPAPPATATQPAFGLSEFPLLPLATTLWTDAAANVINLEAALPRLPDSLIVLAGPTCQGAAIIAGGRATDAVWVNASGGYLGDEAAHALMNSLEGSLTAYRFDDPRIMSALPMLWRAPSWGAGLPGGWLHTDDVVAEVRTSGRSCCLVVESSDPGVALFASGELAAVYTRGHPWPATSMAALRDLLHEPGARVTVLGDTAARPSADEGEDTAPADELAEPRSDVASAAVAGSSDAGVDGAGMQESDADAQPAPLAGPAAEPAAAPDADAGAESLATAELREDTATVTDTDLTPEPEAPEADATPVEEATTSEAPDEAPDEASDEASDEAPRSKGRGRRGKGKADSDAVDAPNETEEPAVIEPHRNGAEAISGATVTAEAPAAPDTVEGASQADSASAASAADALAGTESAAVALHDLEFEAAPRVSPDAAFEPAVFTIADVVPERSVAEPAPDVSGMAGVEAREATEFVPARLEIDVEALRAELTDIATVWLGEDDAAPVARAIGTARPGVDDFVSTIRAIGTMEIPGHESAVVRAMAREMHYRASEVLCGV